MVNHAQLRDDVRTQLENCSTLVRRTRRALKRWIQLGEDPAQWNLPRPYQEFFEQYYDWYWWIEHCAEQDDVNWSLAQPTYPSWPNPETDSDEESGPTHSSGEAATNS